MQAPCYNCQVRTDYCHAGCPAYQDYVRRCRELHEKCALEMHTERAIIDMRTRQRDRYRRKNKRR
jgi:hypothetical protein